jgi:hypothetical protein
LGLFPDAFATWTFAAPTPGTGQENVAHFVSSKKAGKTPRESDLMTSLKFDDPPALFSATTNPGCAKLVAKTGGFGANSDAFKGHDETSTSTQSIIQKHLDDWLASVASDIDCSDPVQRPSEVMCKLGHTLNKQFLDAVTNLSGLFMWSVDSPLLKLGSWSDVLVGVFGFT